LCTSVEFDDDDDDDDDVIELPVIIDIIL